MTEQKVGQDQDRGPGARKVDLEKHLDNNTDVEKHGEAESGGETEPYRGDDSQKPNS